VLSKENNELVTQTGPGTPGGELLRRYWQPVALSEELPLDGAPISTRLFGEELVLFRDEFGNPGLLDRFCSHRGADLSYGRVESGGIRCLYHGWVYDVNGACLDQPAEPPGSSFASKISQRSYPTHEVAGMIFAYLGPGHPPLFPGFEWLNHPPERLFVTKTFHECNWLQGNEGSVDPVHTSFIHRLMDANDPTWMRVEGAEDLTHQDLLMDTRPTIEAFRTEFGLQVFTLRSAGKGRRFVRVESVLFPNGGAYGGPAAGPEYQAYGINWHVPVDDHHHWKFLFIFSNKETLDHAKFKSRMGAVDENYHLVRNKANRFMQDRDQMRGDTFSGLGLSFNEHDAMVTDTMGPILDRSKEHLGVEDTAVIMYRRLLLENIKKVQEGQDPLFVVRSEHENAWTGLAGGRVIPEESDFRTGWLDESLSQFGGSAAEH
jgi:phthalate 4,5-dioxygenase oxygenase subunit